MMSGKQVKIYSCRLETLKGIGDVVDNTYTLFESDDSIGFVRNFYKFLEACVC